MKTEWTPEPWQTRSENQHTEIVGYPDPQNVEFVAETNLDVVLQRPKLSQRCIAVGQSNAARIVSCVNGCQGLNPSAYRSVVEALKRIIEQPIKTGTIGGLQVIPPKAITEAKQALTFAEQP